jgi:ATP-dependent Lon protease
VILSKDNKKDLRDIKEAYIEGLRFHFVEDMMEVVELALLNTKVEKPVDIMAALREQESNAKQS